MRPTFFGTIAGGSSFDPDAQAFITAAGITDPTQQGAIDTLVVGLKADSLWTKFYALYPFVGGTATTHKYNLKDPQDTNGAFRLTFEGTWTHSASGALPDGVSGYADTHCLPSTTMTNNNTHFSMYSGTDSNLGAFDFGVIDGTVNAQYSVRCNLAGGSDLLFDSYSGAGDRVLVANASSLGFYIDSVTSGASHKAYKNGAQTGTTRTPANDITTLAFAVFIASRNFSGLASTFSSREFRFFSIGSGLSDADAANFYTNVQAYQTTLSRQV